MSIERHLDLGAYVQDLVVADKINDRQTARKFIERLDQGKFTRVENPESHLTVYAALFDPNDLSVFMGRHKKSGLLLFNGGHMEPGESPVDTLHREISEEIGNEITYSNTKDPQLLTVSKINNQLSVCEEHFDLWFFVRVHTEHFVPDEEKVLKEYDYQEWLPVLKARKLATDKSTIEALDFLIRKYSR